MYLIMYLQILQKSKTLLVLLSILVKGHIICNTDSTCRLAERHCGAVVLEEAWTRKKLQADATTPYRWRAINRPAGWCHIFNKAGRLDVGNDVPPSSVITKLGQCLVPSERAAASTPCIPSSHPHWEADRQLLSASSLPTHLQQLRGWSRGGNATHSPVRGRDPTSGAITTTSRGLWQQEAGNGKERQKLNHTLPHGMPAAQLPTLLEHNSPGRPHIY